MILVCIESNRALPNSLWEDIYRSVEKLWSSSQGHVCSNYLNIEIWICDPFLADTKSITVAYFDLEDFGTNDLPGFQVKKFQRIQLYLTMCTYLVKTYV